MNENTDSPRERVSGDEGDSAEPFEPTASETEEDDGARSDFPFDDSDDGSKGGYPVNFALNYETCSECGLRYPKGDNCPKGH